jgi:uncharacterized membrane protein YsdA (DUF1294 family)
VNVVSVATVGWLAVSLVAGLIGAVVGMLVVRHNRRSAAERVSRQP